MFVEISPHPIATVPTGQTEGPGNQQPSAPAVVRLQGAAVTGFMDQTQVQVAVTVEERPAVLAVPVTALNPVPAGGYELVVVEGTSTRRVAVEVGIFDEQAGLVEVSGPGLAEGQKVRVPRASS